MVCSSVLGLEGHLDASRLHDEEGIGIHPLHEKRGPGGQAAINGDACDDCQPSLREVFEQRTLREDESSSLNRHCDDCLGPRRRRQMLSTGNARFGKGSVVESRAMPRWRPLKELAVLASTSTRAMAPGAPSPMKLTV